MSFRPFIVFSIVVVFLLSCSSQPVKKKPKTQKKVATQVTPTIKSADDYLTLAQQDYGKSHDIYQRNELILKAAETFQTQQQCAKSIKIIHLLQPEIQDNRQYTLANLVLAECYLTSSAPAFDVVEQILASLTSSYGYETRHAWLKTQLYAHNQQWLKAARAIQQTSIESSEQSTQIWQWVKNLNLAELEQARLKHSELQPWLQLAILVKRYALQPEIYSQELVNWQSRHSDHPLASTLPEEIQRSLKQSPIQPQRIAVLLPLTGRLASRGFAIKEGLLAAYLEDLSNSSLVQEGYGQTKVSQGLPVDASQTIQTQHREIRFFDSALKTTEELNLLVADFDLVVGPLVKEKITALSAVLPADKILLALNRVDLPTQTLVTKQIEITPNFTTAETENSDEDEGQDESQNEHYYFSLAPEDEAEQLALYIKKRQFIRPIVFAAQNSTTERMASAFINKWQENPDAAVPELIIFKDNKDMRLRVSEMLDVKQSKQRIRQIELLADVEVFGVERNRRDIDSIVLFANPEQTKLLNPIIEASLSPFAKKSLSVFASSRSYSSDLNSNNLRDLRNLTFTDMPWMLPDHKWQALANQMTELWPQRQDTLLRLFAMGFDAYNLLPNLRQLKTLPQTSNHGLTGIISANSDGVLYRRLPWAQVVQDRVKLLAMD